MPERLKRRSIGMVRAMITDVTPNDTLNACARLPVLVSNTISGGSASAARWR